MSAESARGDSKWRWALAAVIVVVAATVALWPQFTRSDDKHAATGSATATGPAEPAVAEADRAAAALAACPLPTGAPAGDSPLRGITLDCLADGRSVDLVAALAGKPALLNLWAYWCGPCAEELPLLQQFSQQAGNVLTVLTVHSDPGTGKALSRLSGLGIHLPGVEDPNAKVRTAVGAPAVLPISVLLRADGTVAKVVVRPFTSVEDISATVAAELGVRA
ncbi:TlpA family protein disulfide reductase [Nocardia niigatensis]|uniref:TlpA family protein disulfide reductase n=1 Tax=Nocardia niigatensis TaxID=209249 RepID=UPI0003029D24|nr:TlpA disulfide reductase family protein [Nocardia niigatensis]